MVHILIIEADHWFRAGLVEALRLEGFETVGVQKGQEGLTELTQLCPHLILCGCRLPDMGGHEMIRLLRLNPAAATTSLIFLTSFTAPAYIRQALQLGANDCLTMPFNIDEMLQLIHKYVPIK